jgi:hypothetical protein
MGSGMPIAMFSLIQSVLEPSSMSDDDGWNENHCWCYGIDILPLTIVVKTGTSVLLPRLSEDVAFVLNTHRLRKCRRVFSTARKLFPLAVIPIAFTISMIGDQAVNKL